MNQKREHGHIVKQSSNAFLFVDHFLMIFDQSLPHQM